jgi:5-carboxymethyl-2-hydroxymuconate isomerase
MPHLILEYTADLPREVAGPDLFGRLHGVLVEVGGIALANCKSRAVALERSMVGDGTGEQGFVHLDVRFLEGRTQEVKAAIGQALLAVLREAYAGAPAAVQLTVEIGDIPRAGHFKYPAGTPGAPAGGEGRS